MRPAPDSELCRKIVHCSHGHPPTLAVASKVSRKAPISSPPSWNLCRVSLGVQGGGSVTGGGGGGGGASCLGQHLNHPLLLLRLCLNQPLLLFSLSISFCLSFLFIPLGPELVHLHPLCQEPVHGIHCCRRNLWVSAMGTFGVSCSSPLVPLEGY